MMQRVRAALGLLLSIACTAGSPAAQTPARAGRVRWSDRAHSFQVDLPPDWRQLAPGEVDAVVAALPALPHDLRQNEPSMYYAVGPVDRWLRGDFDGAYLYVVYQENEWQTDGKGADPQLAAQLQAQWDSKGAHDAVRHVLGPVQVVDVGRDRHPAVTCVRTSTPAEGRPQQSLDVYVPTGGIEVTLSFTCWASDFAAREASFREMMGSLAFARKSRGRISLGDRLWTPLLVGGLVVVLLWVLYRSRRGV
jgi:hypothetical protein